MAFQSIPCSSTNMYKPSVSLGWHAVANRHQQESNLIYYMHLYAISYDILSFWHKYLAYLLTFFLAFYLDLSGISSEILCGWGPAGNTLIQSPEVAVRVRRGTLRSRGRRRKEEEGGGRRRKEEEGGGRRRKEAAGRAGWHKI